MSDVHTLVGAYALDAVDPTERAAFEEHLDSCSACVAEVASFAETAARLSVLSGTATLPPLLRPRVLDAAATTRQLPPPSRAASLVGGSVGGEPAAPGRRWRPALLAACVALAVGIGLGAVQPWQDDPAPVTVADTTRQVLDAPDAERVVVRVGEATATLVRSVRVGRAVLVTEAMPVAPDGSVHEIWFASPAGDMVSAGTMPRRTDQTVLLEGDARSATAVGITVEPDGVPHRNPTTEPVVLFDLES